MQTRSTTGRSCCAGFTVACLVAAVTQFTSPNPLVATEPTFRQPPAAGGQSAILSNVNWATATTNTVAADDFVADGRPVTRVEWWGSNKACPPGSLYASGPGTKDLLVPPRLFTIGTSNGQATAIADEIGPVVGTIVEIEWSPDGLTLYGTTGGGFSTLSIIDPNATPCDPQDPQSPSCNEVIAVIPTMPPVPIGAIFGLEFDGDGTLLGTFSAIPKGGSSGPSRLVAIDVNTGTMTTRGLTGFNNIGGLAFDSTFATLYGITSTDDIPPRLLSISPLTGTGTVIAPLTDSSGVPVTFEASSLELLGDNRLVSVGSDGVLYAINRQTNPGRVTPIGALGGPTSISGLSVRPCLADTLQRTVSDIRFDSSGIGSVSTAALGACGNGVIDDGEHCDPPNGVTCDAVCQFIPPIDGWLISFHEPLDADPAPPAEALGLYFCAKAVVQTTNTALGTCDGPLVLSYAADLEDCCLVDFNSDGRSGLTVAGALAFDAEDCTHYSLAIQAVVGAVFLPDGLGGCDEIANTNFVQGDFWGWHSTNTERGLDPALGGVFDNAGGGSWLFEEWDVAVPPCGSPNLAFALVTTTPTPPNTFDVNNDVIPDLAITNCPPIGQNAVATTHAVSLGTNCGPIVDVNVGLRISHTWVGDLVVTLEHDDTQTIKTVGLMSRVGVTDAAPFVCGVCCGVGEDDADLLNLTFDDLAPTSIASAPPVLVGTIAPYPGLTGFEGSLGAFAGMDRCGSWTLRVYDGLGPSDIGTLNAWSLSFVDAGPTDCNGNGLRDFCDIESGLSLDSNANMIPDECDQTNSRYVSFVPGSVADDKAIRVTMQIPGFNVLTRWAGPIQAACGEPSRGLPPCSDPKRMLLATQLQCDAFMGDWSAVDVAHLFGDGVVPGASYQLEICDGPAGPCSALGTVLTGKWADVVPPRGGAGQPDFLDISAIVDAFRDLNNPQKKYRVDLVPSVPNQVVNFLDVSAVVDSFRGNAYPFAGPSTCP